MFAGLFSLTQTLKSARHSKFSGGMERIQLKGVLEAGNGFFVLVKLRLGHADEVKDIRIVRDESGGGLESPQRFFRIRLVLVNQAQRVPGVRIAGIFLN